MTTETATDRTATALSAAISELTFPGSGDRATVADITRDLDHLAHNLVIFLIAAIGLIPAPPGTSFIIGFPLLVVAGQKVLGWPLRLPGAVMRAMVSRDRFEAVRSRILSWLTASETWVRPRTGWHTTPRAGRILDWSVLVLAVGMMIPLPLTAILPAFCICLVTLGRLESDGRWIAAGLIGGIAALIICALMIHISVRLLLLAL